MAFHGPSYGLSRECAMKSAAKYDQERAQACISWIEAVLDKTLELPGDGCSDQLNFQAVLKDGAVLCQLINALKPGTVKKINTMNAPFKQRENIELYLKGCETYGLKTQDLFQVNDLFEAKNLYMIVDNISTLGGMAQKVGFEGPTLGVRVATANKREFTEEQRKAGQNVIGLQYGSNKGASQAGMTSYGTGRQIRPEEFEKLHQQNRT